MKQPKYRHLRNNRKVRKILPPPPGVNLAQVAASCRYECDPYHKGVLKLFGFRPEASICPRELANSRKLKWLRDAVKAGRTGSWDGNFPRYVWRLEQDTAFEARRGSPGSGVYHGYPLDPAQLVEG